LPPRRRRALDKATLKTWCAAFGYEALINTRGTTWRKLDDALKQNLNESRAIAIMLEHHCVIKRPVLVAGAKKLVGFDEAAWKSLI
jgi:arsenate reductase